MQSDHPPRVPRRVTVIGDSIAAGYGLPPAYAWPHLLIKQLAEAHPQFDWRLHNASIPGAATPDAYARFDAIRQSQPHLALIALGINDCRRAHSPVVARRIERFRRNEQTWWGKNPVLRRVGNRLSPLDASQPASPALSQVPLAIFLAILSWMVQQIQTLNAQPAILTMSPLTPELSRSPDFAACPRYNAAIREVARETGAALIEIGTSAPPRTWLPDGIHLSARGQEQLARRVLLSIHRPPIAPRLNLETPASNAQLAPSLD